ncbi:MAG: alpha/beta hydrolase, partial [Bacteroidetes bacterium]|nr:alpha/beta hydrolase [Bacteroidota bacterium]
MRKTQLCLIISLLYPCLVFSQHFGLYKSGFVKAGNANLYYEEKGSGTAVVLIHGSTLDRTIWDAQFDYFSQHYRVIRYDVRNHGLTISGPDSNYYHKDLKILLDSLHVPEAILVG